MLGRLVYSLLVGCLGAVLVHLAIVFLLPTLSNSSAWARITTAFPDGEFSVFKPDAGSPDIVGLDTGHRLGLCPFDLNEGALRFRAAGAVPMWSIAVHDASGNILFSANDRNVADAAVDLAIVNTQQLRTIRQALPDDLSNAVIVPVSDNQGFVTIRVLEPDITYIPLTEAFFATAECGYSNY